MVTSDADELYFADRRKILNEVVTDLEALFDLGPILRPSAMTDMKMNVLLHKLAFMVKQDNDVFELIFKLDQRRHNHFNSLVVLLAEEIRKIKGTDTSKLDTKLKELKNEVADLQQYKSALNLMRELEPDLRDSVEKRKKWKKDSR